MHVRSEALVRTTGKFHCPAPGSLRPTDARSSEVWQRVLTAVGESSAVGEAGGEVVGGAADPLGTGLGVGSAGAAEAVVRPSVAGAAVPATFCGGLAVPSPPPQAVSRPSTATAPASRAARGTPWDVFAMSVHTPGNSSHA